MKKIGLFYSTSTAKTAAVAEKIKKAFDGVQIDIIPIESSEEKDFKAYDQIIAGTSTWFEGELPTYWDEVMPELTSVNFKGKKIAIFGLGDQIKYPDNFVDGIGILAEAFAKQKATLIGFTSPEGYHFSRSLALKKDKLLGLALDIENQSDKVDERIRKWVEQLKDEFANEAYTSDDYFNC